MITPTVGRVVWYFPHGSDLHAHPLAAIITAVWTDTRVNLVVFSQEGVPYPTPPTNVLLVHEENQRPESGRNFCTWMPYQIGQAAKAESLSKALALAAGGVGGDGVGNADVDEFVALGFGDNLRSLLGLKDFLSRIDLSGIDITLLDDILLAGRAVLAAVGTKAQIEAGLALAHLVAAATKKTQADDKFVETVGTILKGPLLDTVAAIVDRWRAQQAAGLARAASYEALTADEEATFAAAGVDPQMVMIVLKMLWDFWQMWQANQPKK